MANLNPTTDIAGYIQTIFDDAVFIARENTFSAPLVTQYNDTFDEAKPRQRSDWSGATISTIGETDDLASQAFTPTADETITPLEKGGQFFIPDKRASADPFGVSQAASMELGMSMSSWGNPKLAKKLRSWVPEESDSTLPNSSRTQGSPPR